MKTIMKSVMVAALFGVSASASAWWVDPGAITAGAMAGVMAGVICSAISI